MIVVLYRKKKINLNSFAIAIIYIIYKVVIIKVEIIRTYYEKNTEPTQPSFV